MKISIWMLFKFLACISFLIISFSSFVQTSLEKEIKQHTKKISGNVGVHAILLETEETLSHNADQKFPMQSVYKFPIAMAVLSKVDQGALALEQIIHVQPSDYIPKEGYSPIREKFPDGVDLTVRDLLLQNMIDSKTGTAD